MRQVHLSSCMVNRTLRHEFQIGNCFPVLLFLVPFFRVHGCSKFSPMNELFGLLHCLDNYPRCNEEEDAVICWWFGRVVPVNISTVCLRGTGSHMSKCKYMYAWVNDKKSIFFILRQKYDFTFQKNLRVHQVIYFVCQQVSIK